MSQRDFALDNPWLLNGLYISALAGTGMASYVMGKHYGKQQMFDDVKAMADPAAEVWQEAKYSGNTNNKYVQDFVKEYMEQHKPSKDAYSYFPKWFTKAAPKSAPLV